MERILVGLDASPRSKDVLAAAIDLAERTGAKLRLIRAVGIPPELPTNVWAVSPAQLTDTFLMTARRDLEDLSTGIPPGLSDGVVAQVGVAWDTICRVAREYDADLIVIGSHGYGLLDRLVGTTAAKVVNHADRSVFVARAREDDPNRVKRA
jgi:nucleotide-binding universal stress UspA family protein